MNVQVVQLPPLYVVLLRHKGAYDQIGPLFDQICGWAEKHGVEMKRVLGVYWDNPEFTDEADLRSAACIEVPLGFQIGERDGLPLEIAQIPSGDYGTTRYVGPYEGLEAAWSELTAQLEGPMGKRISDNPAFEVYVNDASETPASQLITELYMPLA